MAEGYIAGKDVIVYTYNINDQDSEQILSYPQGINVDWSSTVLRVYTIYNSWVYPTYNDGQFFGQLLFLPSGIVFRPNTLGNCTKLNIAFFRP